MPSVIHTKHVRAVCDMTIAYAHGNNFMQAPSSRQTISTADLAKERYKFYIHDDRYDTNELPESEGLSKWLEERWIKKGKRLEMPRDKLARGEEWEGGRYVNEARKAKAPPTHDKLKSARPSLAINC